MDTQKKVTLLGLTADSYAIEPIYKRMERKKTGTDYQRKNTGQSREGTGAKRGLHTLNESSENFDFDDEGQDKVKEKPSPDSKKSLQKNHPTDSFSVRAFNHGNPIISKRSLHETHEYFKEYKPEVKVGDPKYFGLCNVLQSMKNERLEMAIMSLKLRMFSSNSNVPSPQNNKSSNDSK